MFDSLSQWEEVQAHFGLSQAALGRLLGLRPAMMNHVATGRCSLPAAALPTWTRLVLALSAPSAAPPEAAPTEPPASLSIDARHPLALHGQQCVARAARLAVELADAQAKAAWATQRLAALSQLAAALLPTGTSGPPPWLVQFASEARVALAEAGPVVQARLVLRRAALLHEAELAHHVLLGEELTNLVDEAKAVAFSALFNPLPQRALLAFSAHRFTTKAQCQAYLDKKAPERTRLAAQLVSIEADLATWDAAGNPAAGLATAKETVGIFTTAHDATTDPKEKLRFERLISSYNTRIANLDGRTETHGPNERLDREQDLENYTSSLRTLDRLLAEVTTRRDALSA